MKRYQQHTHASWHKAYADNHDCPWCLENPALRDNAGPSSRPQSKLRTRVPTRNGHSRMGTVSPSPSVHTQQQPVKYEQEHEHQYEQEHYGQHSLPEDQVADSQVESHHTADSADVDTAHVENDVASHDVEDASHVHDQEQSLNEAVDDSAVEADRQFSPEISDDRTSAQ
ncbi:hypothetical protein PENANT_c023G05082 [Penicillium antarcticum]|uniref:Uncharacterized protein n=1 Tax=Penicillium antarcticum TaxID=416450 RepID=A0A1V6PYW0_9EURO|nr:uncharacterized protein N7508_006255 [Penicillium antarcticum]KAJ5301392.1 hypothetical protein N7508_006255 [Penicillium antarcticum]OQD82204.1 hypothetical protein PENANT_c023G05082 [Penicillium antarcticum]